MAQNTPHSFCCEGVVVYVLIHIFPCVFFLRYCERHLHRDACGKSNPMSNKAQDADAAALANAAEDAVRGALIRGQERRARGRRGRGRTGDAAGVAGGWTRRIARQVAFAPHERVQAASLIPGEVEEDGESNDEWEEHVEVDVRNVRAAVEAAEAAEAARIAAQAEKEAAAEMKLEDSVAGGAALSSAPRGVLTQAERMTQARLVAAQQRKRALNVHGAHLALLAAMALRMDTAAADEEVQGICLSLVPEDASLACGANLASGGRFALWFRSHFSPALLRQGPSKLGRRPCSVAERVLRCAVTANGDVLDLVVLAAAAVRAEGSRCRIVTPMQPVPHIPPKVTKSVNQITGRRVVQTADDKKPAAVLHAWIEIWVPALSRWMPVDVCSGIVDGTEQSVILGSIESILETEINISLSTPTTPLLPSAPAHAVTPGRVGTRSGTRRRRPEAPQESPTASPPPEQSGLPRRSRATTFRCELFHVVAAENGRLTDVTRRYVRLWKDTEKARAKDRLLERVLDSVSLPNNGDVAVRESEANEFDALSAGEAVPTSIAALHKHPRYVLERHLKKYESVFPREPIVAYIKKEPVFLRSHVKLLHTKDRWLREMQEVRPDESPAKTVKSKKDSTDSAELFGEWQTIPLVIPDVVDGKVPRSKHGNVDLWTPDHLPRGAAHVNERYAAAAARQLGFDYAPAMTGFEAHRGRPVPRIEGVVVAAENAELVADAARVKALAMHDRAETRAREEACKHWKQLMRAVEARARVQRKYGGIIEDVGTFEAVQKRNGERRAREEKAGKAVTDIAEGSRAERQPKRRKRASTEAHEHTYGEARPLEREVWVKECAECGLTVTFERL